MSTKITYDSFGRRESLTHSTGLSGTWSYDEINRPKEIKWNQAGQNFWNSSVVFASETLNYNANSQIIAEDRKLGTIDYGYDPTGQLTAVNLKQDFKMFPGFDYRSSFTRDFTYDANGNRVNDTLRGPASFVDDQIVSNNHTTYSSDTNGWGTTVSEVDSVNRLSKTYGYRADDRLSHFEKSLLTSVHDCHWGDPLITSTDYSFDALGRRVAKTIHSKSGSSTQTFSYLIDQDKILLGKAVNGQVTMYIDGLGIDEHLGEVNGSSSLGYATDHLGSVLNTAPGGFANSFGPYGELLPGTDAVIAGSNAPVLYGFAGRQYDKESGLYYNRARMYDPSIGRWLTKDPLGFGGGDSNLFGYVANDPINFVDPTGLICNFSQSSGTTICSDIDGNITMINANGYSGSGAGKNNPAMQAVPFQGPIPQGSYTVGPAVPRTPNGLRNALPLTPNEGTDTFGRDQFFIHGDNPATPGNSSSGCPIMGPANRSLIPPGETFNVVE